MISKQYITDVRAIKAKLFNKGKRQAVRIPVAFHFEGDEVYIRKDPLTGDVILSQKPNTWDNLFALLDQIPDTDTNDFLKDRDISLPQVRNLF